MGKKPPKDLNAPKKPLTSYFIFSNKRRPELKKDHKNKKITELSKLIAAEWKLLTDEQKQPYADQAQKDKQTYNKKFEKYKHTENYKQHQKKLKEWKENNEMTSNGKSSGKKSGTKSKYASKPPKKPKAKNAPKKNASSYFMFSNERRPQLKEQYPNKKITELAKMIGEDWKQLTPEQRKPYQIKSKQAKEKYELEYAKYKETPEHAQYLIELNKWKESVRKWKKNQEKNNESSSDSSSSSGSSDDSSDSDDDSSSSGSSDSSDSSNSDSDDEEDDDDDSSSSD